MGSGPFGAPQTSPVQPFTRGSNALLPWRKPEPRFECRRCDLCAISRNQFCASGVSTDARKIVKRLMDFVKSQTCEDPMPFFNRNFVSKQIETSKCLRLETYPGRGAKPHPGENPS